MSNEPNELTRLRAENARLIALRESHGIDWRHDPATTTPSAAPELEPPSLSTAEKVALFRRLFRGRTDVHPVRWERATTGKSGYAPACAKEWRPGICETPLVKCADCGNRSLIPVSDAVIYCHLVGEKTIGVYPLLPDDTTFSPSNSTRPNGGRTPPHLFNPVTTWMCLSLRRYRALATARTHGFSSRLRDRRAMPDAWARQPSVIPAAVPGNSA